MELEKKKEAKYTLRSCLTSVFPTDRKWLNVFQGLPPCPGTENTSEKTCKQSTIITCALNGDMINLIPACLKIPQKTFLESNWDEFAFGCIVCVKIEAKRFYPICWVDQVTVMAWWVKPRENCSLEIFGNLLFLLGLCFLLTSHTDPRASLQREMLESEWLQ